MLHEHTNGESSRFDAVANNNTAVGWVSQPTGWWEGHVWQNGEELSLKSVAPGNPLEVGQATGINSDGSMVIGIDWIGEDYSTRGYTYNTVSGEFTVLDIYEDCPPWDWFCWGSKPFNPADISDDGTIVGAMGSAGSASATLFNDVLASHKMVDFLKAQGVMNANDLGLASFAVKITSNGKHITGWTLVDGYSGSFKLTLDQLYVCRNGKTMQVGYPGGVASQLKKGATLGMCEADLPLQYKANF